MARPSCWSPTTHKLLSGRGAQSACVMAASRRPKQDGWKYPHEPRDGCDRTLRAGLCRARGRCHSPPTFGPAAAREAVRRPGQSAVVVLGLMVGTVTIFSSQVL